MSALHLVAVLDEFHDGPVSTVHAKCRFNHSVHGDVALLLHGCHGDYVCQRLWVKPHGVDEILEVPNLRGCLGATISVH